ncbi:MAG: flagellar hook-basal body complex protein FliE [Burkholderiales bacterium]|nr:flagellar hook-basal body complex protein FliE [Burkholderiales bacterium]
MEANVSINGLGIDSSRIESMLAQLKAHATSPSNRASFEALKGADGINASADVSKVNFADALKAQLDQVAQTQNTARDMGQAFSAGDDRVNLSDVMIATQKAGIAFQATVQVRNKLVTAYQEMMNMQV